MNNWRINVPLCLVMLNNNIVIDLIESVLFQHVDKRRYYHGGLIERDERG